MRYQCPMFARLAASLALLLVASALLTACGTRSEELQPGAWRAVLEVPGGELPFGLDVSKEENGFVLALVNGEERVRVTEVAVAEGTLTATMPGSENTLVASIEGDELEGEVTIAGPDGERQVLPFEAKHGQAWRFFEEPLTDNADVSGYWTVTFTDDEGRSTAGTAEFRQSFGIVTGTVQGPAGEHPNLAGEIRDDELYLSRFDGVSAYLYRAKVNEHGELVGECRVPVLRLRFRAERPRT